MNQLKNKYDVRLLQYFNTFMKEKINGSEFKIQPKIKDIPIIKNLGYDESSDTLEVVFEILPFDKVHTRIVDDVVFIDDEKGRLVAIQFLNCKRKNINNIRLTLNTDLDREIREISIGLETGKGDLSLTLIEKRKLKYIKEVIGNNLEEIMKIKNSNLIEKVQ